MDRKQVVEVAERLSISTQDLFYRAHRECHGLNWGLHGPKTLHELWQKGYCITPPYVEEFVRQCASGS